MKSWWFSLTLLVGYVLTFQLWLKYPDRTVFLVIGSLAVAVMAFGLRQAARRGYFADRTDLVLHGLVIVDVALETASYEAFHQASMCILCTPGNPDSFHSNYNFCWCTAILGLLVGGYHAWALRRVRTSVARTRGGATTEGESKDPISAGAGPTPSSTAVTHPAVET